MSRAKSGEMNRQVEKPAWGLGRGEFAGSFSNEVADLVD